MLWSLLLLRFSLCSCFGQEGGFFPPAHRSGHIGIEAFRHIHIHRHRDIVKNANIRTNGFNRRPDGEGGTCRKQARPLPPLPLAPHGPSRLVLGLERRWKWYIVCSY